MLRSGRWFAQLPPDFAQGLLAMARVRYLQAGEKLFLREAAPCGLYAVVRGTIRISGHSGKAMRPAKRYWCCCHPRNGSAKSRCLMDLPAPTTPMRPKPAPCCTFRMKNCSHGSPRHPAHWRDLAVLMADKLRLAFVSMEEQTVLPAPQRLARRLLTMALSYGQATESDRTLRVLAVTQEQLALMIGVSRQTTNQILRDFKARGVLQAQRGSIELLDLQALRAECE